MTEGERIATWIESLGFMPRDTSVLSGKMIIAAKIDAAIASARPAMGDDVRGILEQIEALAENENDEIACKAIAELAKAALVAIPAVGDHSGESTDMVTPADEAIIKAAKAAMMGLRSYQYGNAATELAKELADNLEAALAAIPAGAPAPADEAVERVVRAACGVVHADTYKHPVLDREQAVREGVAELHAAVNAYQAKQQPVASAALNQQPARADEVESIKNIIDTKMRKGGLTKGANEAGIYMEFIVRETIAALNQRKPEGK